jgi:hypothetical protein
MALSAECADAYQSALADVSMVIDGAKRRPVISPDWLVSTHVDAGGCWRTACKDDLFAGLRASVASRLAEAA